MWRLSKLFQGAKQKKVSSQNNLLFWKLPVIVFLPELTVNHLSICV